ncbi:tonB-system energizer ExbB [Sphingobium sp. SCG-1]|uniref:tonB-system energizer ExbB n=1 Tax=Sphingobium sp. SCG-1 TaxID=2072936 RepID=UPI000CD68D76|nr:tonB-system energizer ExbB [Sphingobium sp. SCG-1]AUW59756.1 tonB-system energizer ExbB [Sphingobium sp. SCG-1]
MRARWSNGLKIAGCGLAVLLVTSAVSAGAAGPQAPTIVVTQNDGILQIVAHADPIVKGVMALLVIASIATWTLWIMKGRELRDAKTCLKKDICMMSAVGTLKEARSASYRATLEMVEVAATELQRVGPAPTHRQIEGVEERVAVQLPMVEARAIHRVLWGTSVLASIGAISPFVGLAGTVWGIMNSFMGISRSHSTSLAVVAPGIAEALLATAIGLAAAIPAVLIYNSLSRSIASYKRLLNEVAVLAACLLSRESERIEVQQDASGARARPSGRPEAVVAIALSTEGR